MFRQFFKKTHAKLKEVASRRRHDEDALDAAAVPVAVPHKQITEITVSSATMAKFIALTILLLIAAYFLYWIRDILVIFFVSLLFAAALDPMVDALERRKIPRSLGVLIIYFAILFLLGLVISNLVPILATEIAALASRIQEFIGNLVSGKIELPSFLEGFRPTLQKLFEGVDVSKLGDYKEVLLKFAQKLSDVAGNVLNGILVIFNGLFNTLLILVITFLMTVDEQGIDKFILSLFPSRHADYIRQKSNAVKEKIGYWLRGQIVLCVIVGALVYIGLLIIGLLTKKVEYAATIAMVAGLTELIPYAGPFVAWIIALPIAANQSLMLIVWVTALMYIVQVLENNFIVPMVMHRAVGISPIFVMFAMLVGFSFLGILGIVLSVPVATAVAIFVKDYAQREK